MLITIIIFNFICCTKLTTSLHIINTYLFIKHIYVIFVFFDNRYILLPILITTHCLRVCVRAYVQVWAEQPCINWTRLLWCCLMDLHNAYKPTIRSISSSFYHFILSFNQQFSNV